MVGVKRDETWVKDPVSGIFRARAADIEVGTVRCETDLQIDLALRRRGLAMDMGDLMSWEVHETLRADLMSALVRQQPPGMLECRWPRFGKPTRWPLRSWQRLLLKASEGAEGNGHLTNL